jgi:hypothetical protein
MLSPRSPRVDVDRKKPRNRALPPEQWYDVQDEEGNWRVGFCEKADLNYKVVSLDGFHPSHTAVPLFIISTTAIIVAKLYLSEPIHVV